MAAFSYELQQYSITVQYCAGQQQNHGWQFIQCTYIPLAGCTMYVHTDVTLYTYRGQVVHTVGSQYIPLAGYTYTVCRLYNVHTVGSLYINRQQVVEYSTHHWQVVQCTLTIGRFLYTYTVQLTGCAHRCQEVQTVGRLSCWLFASCSNRKLSFFLFPTSPHSKMSVWAGSGDYSGSLWFP